VNDQANPGDETGDGLTIPELMESIGEDGELLELASEEVLDEAIETVARAPMDLPDDPAEAVPVLISALVSTQAEASGYLETMQRVAAEFDNFRKRSARERTEIVDRASQRVIERLLPTLDSFDAALAYEAQSETEERLLAGMADTHRLLMEALAVDGFAPIDASGVPFDPAVHEAVTGPSGDGEGELVVREMRRGYTLGGRVVRAALVAVEHA
jgi:molecular chaperone GrpE